MMTIKKVWVDDTYEVTGVQKKVSKQSEKKV